MTPTPLSAIADMPDGLPVLCIEGVVKYTGKLNKGITESTGNEWSRQFFVLAQNGAEVGCTLWDAAGNEVKKGEHLCIENTQNKKKQWSAITKQSYEKDGKTNHTLEIRAEQAKIKNLSGGKSNRGEHTTDEPPLRTMAGQDEYEPRGNLTQIDQRDIPSDGINEARQHLCQAANLYNLCVKAVDAMIAPELPEVARTSEQFQATLASLFIEASSRRTTDGVNWWSYVDKMPTKPLPVHNGNEKVERLPSKYETIVDDEREPDEPPF